ncbi:fructosamine-3-kinase [Belliella baltica DSM 15883]|uniref:Fructosamine-3-kinase n=1 Tax=Belliella baltica (strain DSM 15883 / CIP 108006 / LMG 21964 / BA134) TaxID=866536 RepID=I3Z4N9_BELBD|nr:fructosamine kinase family protein [Belliella baltica]AFL84207.1 fructosamine-3-kinase [Belliella baltica DSM 15883]
MFDLNARYEQILFLSFGKEIEVNQARLVAAGNVNQGIQLITDKGSYFLKVNFENTKDIFEKEALGLRLLSKSCPLTVPEVIYFGEVEDFNFLLMEWIDSSERSIDYWEKLGEGLAQMHMTTQESFGLTYSNYISSLSQNNQYTSLWADFFIDQRLEPLIGRAFFEGLVDESFLKKFRLIYPKLRDFFPKERPALVHGDLWSGNVMADKNGHPSLIDPAIYYGNREIDLAFSRMFGGFDQRFYDAYNAIFPLSDGFEDRKEIYNLYPLLVHLLLFGKSYLSGIQKTVNKLI